MVEAENYIEFDLGKGTQRIEFKNIKSYLVQHYGGIYLKILQNDSKKLTISTNENFCDPSAFELLCEDFETVIDKTRKESNLPIIRKKTFFEKKWFFILLIIMTLLFIGAIFKGILTDRNSYASLFMTLGTLIAMWGAYFTTRIKAKNRIE